MRVGQYVYESESYRAARAALLAEELALRDHRERVAAMRRAMPYDVVAEDYLLHEVVEGQVRPVRLSELFVDPAKPLVLYQYMLGGAQQAPCPSCTMWTDGLDAVAPHVGQRVNFAVVAAAPIEEWQAWGSKRGWRNVRLVSSADSQFKADFNFSDADDDQYPGVSVFTYEQGEVRHVYSASAILAEGEYRGIDLLTPVWHLFDLTPEGRGDWYPQLSY